MIVADTLNTSDRRVRTDTGRLAGWSWSLAMLLCSALLMLGARVAKADEAIEPLLPIPEAQTQIRTASCPDDFGAMPAARPCPLPESPLQAGSVVVPPRTCVELKNEGAWALIGCHGALYIDFKAATGIVLVELPSGMHAAVLARSIEMEKLYGGWYIFTEVEEKTVIGVTKVWAVRQKSAAACTHAVWYGEGQPKSVGWLPVHNARANSLKTGDSLIRRLQTQEIPDEPEAAPAPEENDASPDGPLGPRGRPDSSIPRTLPEAEQPADDVTVPPGQDPPVTPAPADPGDLD